MGAIRCAVTKLFNFFTNISNGLKQYDKLIEFRESELQKNSINYNKNNDSFTRNRFYCDYDFLFTSM